MKLFNKTNNPQTCLGKAAHCQNNYFQLSLRNSFMNQIKRFKPTRAAQTLACLLLTLLLADAAWAQNVKNTDYSPDKSLKSNARVNPSTLAMELSIPISGYPGRAGNSLPVTFDYSSKVWEIQPIGTWLDNFWGPKTDTRPLYAKRTAAGWTSNLGTPRIDYKYDVYRGNDQDALYEGQIYQPSPTFEDTTADNVYYIKRLRVQMPGGSTHEFRASDTPIHCGDTVNGCTGVDLTGTFLSVDGSKMRLESGSTESILYMPDGSRYFFGQHPGGNAGNPAHTFFDRHGNKMTYDTANKQWTDTLGRIVTDPIPMNWNGTQNQTAGDTTAGFPGFNGGTINITLSWRYLKDPNGGESGLEDTSQTLAHTSTIRCQGQLTPSLAAPNLFTNSGGDSRVCGAVDRFNPVVLTKITLPNGQSYQFKYNLYGEVIKVVYPTGAYERFLYGWLPAVQVGGSPYDMGNRGVLARWVSAKGDGTDELHWTYSASRGSSYPFTPYTVTVNAPDGSRTEQLLHDENDTNIHQPYGFGNEKTGRPFETRAYSTNNHLMSRTLTDYEVTGPQSGGYSAATRDIRPTKQISMVFEPNNGTALATMSETVYDSNSDAQYFASLNAVQGKKYHYVALSSSSAQTSNLSTITALFGTNQLASISETDYLYNAGYKARNIAGLPTASRVKDAAGTIKAQSQILYDEGALPLISAGTHSQWVDPQTTVRGNVTTTKSWDNSTNTWLETHAQYDNFGNLRKSWDAKGNLSETEYASTYGYAYPTKVITPVPDPTGQNGSSTSFETVSTYDPTTGLALTTTDANGQTSQMEYNNSMLRPTRVIPPSGGAVQEMVYNDTPGSLWVKTRSQIDGTNWSEAISYLDGLGRTKATQKKDAQGDVFTEILYDNMGRAKQVTNPFRANETKVWTVTNYDEAGRAKETITPDGAIAQTAYTLSTSGTHVGTSVIVTDQAGKIRRSVTNALGQLVRVDEPDASGNLGAISSPAQATAYAYDTLSNLTHVYQGVQTRTFAYDSLSRLRQAVNPESGTISYNYDANGNLTTKTDARSVTTTYGYDNLNRALTRSYSDGTPAVAYKYDDGSIQYSKGKLTRVSSLISETRYTQFSNLGNVLATQQVTDNVTFNFGYSYNLAGMLVSETYPSGRVVSNQFQTDGNLAQVNGLMNNVGKTYAGNISYTSAGAVSSMQLGNGRWESAGFNARLQPTQLALGTTQNGVDMWKVNYEYDSGTNDNNGNIKKQTITVPSLNPIVQNYTYDSLNRIKSAAETSNNQPSWQQVFNYDRYGNRNFDANNTTTLGNCPANQCNPTVDTANNRFTTNQGYTYDLAGNVITDANSRTFYYDAENKQKEVRDGSNNIIGQYFYDGDGKRVKKLSDAEATIFVYDGAGKLAVEYTVTTQTPQNLNTSYLTNDHLGSPRIITDQAGNVTSRKDFLPFGEEILNLSGRSQSSGYQADSVRQKFTGYERDSESDLDFAQARMYSSKLGRFLTTDPLNPVLGRQEASNQKEANREFTRYLKQPQNWNRYTYSLNNPLRYTDPDGFQPITVKINIIFDKNSNYTDEEMQKFRDTYVSELQKNFKDVDIIFDVTYNIGTASNLGDHTKQGMTSGVVGGALNVFATKKSVGPSPEIASYSKGEVWLNTEDGDSSLLSHGVIHALGIAAGVNGYTPQDNNSKFKYKLIYDEFHTRLFGNSAEAATVNILTHLQKVANGGYTYRGQETSGGDISLYRPNYSKEYGYLREGAKRFEKK